jgi:hypothetical protein
LLPKIDCGRVFVASAPCSARQLINKLQYLWVVPVEMDGSLRWLARIARNGDTLLTVTQDLPAIFNLSSSEHLSVSFQADNALVLTTNA